MLLKKYEQLVHLVKGFSQKWGLIQCGGAVDRCHISVKPNYTDYWSCYLVILQGVVDHEYLCCDVYVGYPDSVHDACTVCLLTQRFKLGSESNILQGDKVRIGEVDVPILLSC